MFVIIAGGGRTGAQLATLLVNQNHKVHLIEQRQEVLDRIHHELPTEVIFQGDPTNPGVLESAGIREAQVLAACTTHDADNLVLCYMARERYGVGRTIARINNPRSAWFFDEKFHVDVALNQADLMARLAKGTLDPMVDEVIGLADIPDALGRLRRREVTGKIVARLGDAA